MKNRALNICAILAVVALMATPVAFAQVQYMTANIPFDFSVGNRTLPAGTYEVKCANGAAQTLILRGVDVKVAHIAVTQPTISGKFPSEGKLIFHRYGNSYFLSQVWKPGERTGNELRPSKAEREMAAKAAAGATTEVAANRTSN